MSGYGVAMSIVDRFHRVRHAREDDRSAEALPTTLVESCRDLFELDAVGISLTGEVRVPLAATSTDAVTAEALQTTLGEGPCLTAAGHGTALVADAASMAATWPMFGAALTSGTPFRSVASVPLRIDGGSPFGAVDLYSVDATSRQVGRGDQGCRAGRGGDGGLVDRRRGCWGSSRCVFAVDAVTVGESSFPGVERGGDDDGVRWRAESRRPGQAAWVRLQPQPDSGRARRPARRPPTQTRNHHLTRRAHRGWDESRDRVL